MVDELMVMVHDDSKGMSLDPDEGRPSFIGNWSFVSSRQKYDCMMDQGPTADKDDSQSLLNSFLPRFFGRG
jgi:hypothetical protein